jgi:2-oxo-3-hexenedioate decarboxylase
MTSSDLSRLSELLHAARLETREIERLTVKVADLSVTDAYEVQADGVRRRLAAGERQVGLKMGLTSEAKRKQMNLDSPVYGVLTDKMLVPAGGKLKLSSGIHPKIEPELAFRIGLELNGPITIEEAAAACSGVAPAMEILDSRYVGFKYFSLPDVIADNSSSFMFVVGTFQPLADRKLDQLSMVMRVNGENKQQATSDAISGHPLRSIVQLCALLGRPVPAGSIVLAGAATVAESLRAGDRVELEVEGLGSVAIDVG